MQGVRYVAKLNHFRHVLNMLACAAHVDKTVHFLTPTVIRRVPKQESASPEVHGFPYP